MSSNLKGVVVGLAVLLALALLMGALLPSTTLAGPAAQGTETATSTGGGGTTLPTTGAVPAQGGSFVLVIGLAGVALLGAGYALSKNAKK